jgi:hypothetical protein
VNVTLNKLISVGLNGFEIVLHVSGRPEIASWNSTKLFLSEYPIWAALPMEGPEVIISQGKYLEVGFVAVRGLDDIIQSQIQFSYGEEFETADGTTDKIGIPLSTLYVDLADAALLPEYDVMLKLSVNNMVVSAAYSTDGGANYTPVTELAEEDGWTTLIDGGFITLDRERDLGPMPTDQDFTDMNYISLSTFSINLTETDHTDVFSIDEVKSTGIESPSQY